MRRKKCRICGSDKPLSQFYINKCGADTRHTWCKKCTRQRARELHAKRIQDPAIRKKYSSRYIKATYGISIEEYEERLNAQQLCAICGRQLVRSKNAHLDHDHKTGRLRKFLCTNCNHGLGSFRDDVVVMQNAIDYLNAHTEHGNQKEVDFNDSAH